MSLWKVLLCFPAFQLLLLNHHTFLKEKKSHCPVHAVSLLSSSGPWFHSSSLPGFCLTHFRQLLKSYSKQCSPTLLGEEISQLFLTPLFISSYYFLRMKHFPVDLSMSIAWISLCSPSSVLQLCLVMSTSYHVRYLFSRKKDYFNY